MICKMSYPLLHKTFLLIHTQAPDFFFLVCLEELIFNVNLVISEPKIWFEIRLRPKKYTITFMILDLLALIKSDTSFLRLNA